MIFNIYCFSWPNILFESDKVCVIVNHVARFQLEDYVTIWF